MEALVTLPLRQALATCQPTPSNYHMPRGFSTCRLHPSDSTLVTAICAVRDSNAIDCNQTPSGNVTTQPLTPCHKNGPGNAIEKWVCLKYDVIELKDWVAVAVQFPVISRRARSTDPFHVQPSTRAASTRHLNSSALTRCVFARLSPRNSSSRRSHSKRSWIL